MLRDTKPASELGDVACYNITSAIKAVSINAAERLTLRATSYRRYFEHDLKLCVRRLATRIL